MARPLGADVVRAVLVARAVRVVRVVVARAADVAARVAVAVPVVRADVVRAAPADAMAAVAAVTADVAAPRSRIARAPISSRT